MARGITWPPRKKSNGVRSHDAGGQLSLTFLEITRPANCCCYKTIIWRSKHCCLKKNKVLSPKTVSNGDFLRIKLHSWITWGYSSAQILLVYKPIEPEMGSIGKQYLFCEMCGSASNWSRAQFRNFRWERWSVASVLEYFEFCKSSHSSLRKT